VWYKLALFALTDKIQAEFAVFKSSACLRSWLTRLADDIGPGCKWPKIWVPCWSYGGHYHHLTGPAGVGLHQAHWFMLGSFAGVTSSTRGKSAIFVPRSEWELGCHLPSELTIKNVDWLALCISLVMLLALPENATQFLMAWDYGITAFYGNDFLLQEIAQI
jgi:hypothetical protein